MSSDYYFYFHLKERVGENTKSRAQTAKSQSHKILENTENSAALDARQVRSVCGRDKLEEVRYSFI